MKSSYFKILLISLILLLGLSLRLNNINWDFGAHLQPDERFLTMVGNKIQLPVDFNSYFDPKTSSLNPANNGFEFYVYGLFPVTIDKLLAFYRNTDNYVDFTLQGRVLSAIFDWLIIIFVYKTLFLLEKKYKFDKSIKYWGAFFYSILVLPIQLSHFFAVDTFLNFFVFSSFYFSLKYYLFDNNKNIVYSSILFGCAIASKITAFYILPLNLFLILLKKKKTKSYIRLIVGYLLLSYVTLRFADPYLFQNSNLFDPTPSKLFLNNLNELTQLFGGKNTWYPPGIQWIGKIPIIFSLKNLIVYGVGYFISVLFILGVFYSVKYLNEKLFRLILFWVIGFFIFQSVQFAQFMRYFIPLYPFIAVFSALGIFYILSLIKNKKHINFYIFLFIFLSLIWPLSFSQIYKKENTRVEASKWIYQNIDKKNVLLGEHWDDALPLQVGDRIVEYERYELPVFEMDAAQKWDKINNLLSKGDYLILSSNRGWGSITKVPEKFPLMSGFYEKLFNKGLNFKKVKEFKSFPTFYASGLNVLFNDSTAEESFTVYDHPEVLIFKKTSQ